MPLDEFRCFMQTLLITNDYMKEHQVFDKCIFFNRRGRFFTFSHPFVCNNACEMCRNRFNKVNKRKKKKKQRPVMKHKGSDCEVKSGRGVVSLGIRCHRVAFPLPCDSHCAHRADVSCDTRETNGWGGGEVGSSGVGGEINEVSLARSIQHPRGAHLGWQRQNMLPPTPRNLHPS